MSVGRCLFTLAAVGAAFTLAACGSSSTPAAQPTSSASPVAASTTPSATSSSPASSSSPAGASSAGAPSVAEFCSFLTKGLPEWKAVGSQVGAQAQYTIAVAGWAGDKLTLDLVQQLDAGAVQQCPKVRSDVLALIGQQTLAG